MAKIILYHGSNAAIEVPDIMINGHYKDFGYGFYCTKLEYQARRWALTKRGASIVSKYTYAENDNLKTLAFNEMAEEWLDFIVDCRRGIEHSYDIVEGPMADDQIWDYVESFAAGEITRSAFWELVKFRYPTHQIVFCAQEALQTLHYEGSETV